MATLTCIGTGCGTELGPADLLCPACGSPRPRSSLLAASRAEGSSGDDPGPYDGPGAHRAAPDRCPAGVHLRAPAPTARALRGR